jgi:ubiquitin-conjugating enzyme E2 O
MHQGEVGVSFFPNGVRDILPESSFTLVDRSFQAGDLCKRSIDDVRSGVVTRVDVKARLAHAISDVPVEGWKSIDQFEKSTTAEVGDYVLCDDWVGQVGIYLDFIYLDFV